MTASGGPFRGRSRVLARRRHPEQALAHPNFSMGRVITTNSATIVNKGLEVIEAHLLFDIPFDRIDVVVHPQQMIHSMVEFVDGSTIAQAGPPGCACRSRSASAGPTASPEPTCRCDWTKAPSVDFEPLDERRSPRCALARRAGKAGGTWPAVYNAANEECVDAFLEGRLGSSASSTPWPRSSRSTPSAGLPATYPDDVLAPTLGP